MAECGKEFGVDFTKTLYLPAILIWPTLTKRLFLNEIIKHFYDLLYVTLRLLKHPDFAVVLHCSKIHKIEKTNFGAKICAISWRSAERSLVKIS
jgi:hypothetical protein